MSQSLCFQLNWRWLQAAVLEPARTWPGKSAAPELLDDGSGGPASYGQRAAALLDGTSALQPASSGAQHASNDVRRALPCSCAILCAAHFSKESAYTSAICWPTCATLTTAGKSRTCLRCSCNCQISHSICKCILCQDLQQQTASQQAAWQGVPPLCMCPFQRKPQGCRTSCGGWLQAVEEPPGASSRCAAAGPQNLPQQEQGSRPAGSHAAAACRAPSLPSPAALQVEAPPAAAGRGSARRASATLLDVEFPDEPTLRQRVDPVT